MAVDLVKEVEIDVEAVDIGAEVGIVVAMVWGSSPLTLEVLY